MRNHCPFTLSFWVMVQLQELHASPSSRSEDCLLCRHAHTNTHMHTSMHTYLHPCTFSLEPSYRSPLPETHHSGPHDLKPRCPWIQPSPMMTLFKMSTSSSQASCIFPFLFFPLCSSFWRPPSKHLCVCHVSFYAAPCCPVLGRGSLL